MPVSSFLKVVAKIGLDLLVGQKRTDELVQLFQGSAKKDAAEIVDSPQSARLIREAVAAEAGPSATAAQLETVAAALTDGLELVAEGKITELEKFADALERKRGTYAVWLPAEVIGGDAGRYVHFNWKATNSYRVRDYLGGCILYPAAGAKGADEGSLRAVPLALTAEQVWQRSRGRIQCLTRYGLYRQIAEIEAWTQTLRLLTAAADSWGAPADGT